MSEYQWDGKAGRYRIAGRYAKSADALRDVDLYLQARQSAVADALFDLLRDGRISVADLQLRGEREIAKVHLVAAMAAKGGREQMSPADFGRVGSLVKPQLRYWRDRMKAVAAGQPVDGRLRQSMRAYLAAGGATYQTFEGIEADRHGYDEERWILNDGMRHCSDCPPLARLGWVKRGRLPLRGTQTECRHHCGCFKRYRNSKTGQVRQ